MFEFVYVCLLEPGGENIKKLNHEFYCHNFGSEQTDRVMVEGVMWRIIDVLPKWREVDTEEIKERRVQGVLRELERIGFAGAIRVGKRRKWWIRSI